MRQDQFESLQKRAEQLVDLFILESDPEKWPGVGIEPAKMDKSTRGDRYWCKKDAVATLACAQRIVSLIDTVRAKTSKPTNPDNPGAVTDGDDVLDGDVAAAEKEADRILRNMKNAAKPNAKP